MVVYLNGVEIWRDNMNPGDVTALNTSRYSVDGEVNEKRYYNSNNLTRGSAALLKVLNSFVHCEITVSQDLYYTLGGYKLHHSRTSHEFNLEASNSLRS